MSSSEFINDFINWILYAENTDENLVYIGENLVNNVYLWDNSGNCVYDVCGVKFWGNPDKGGGVCSGMTMVYMSENNSPYLSFGKIKDGNKTDPRLTRDNSGNYILKFTDNKAVSTYIVNVSFCMNDITSSASSTFASFVEANPKYVAMCCSSHSIDFTSVEFNPTPPNKNTTLTCDGTVVYDLLCKNEFQVKNFPDSMVPNAACENYFNSLCTNTPAISCTGDFNSSPVVGGKNCPSNFPICDLSTNTCVGTSSDIKRFAGPGPIPFDSPADYCGCYDSEGENAFVQSHCAFPECMDSNAFKPAWLLREKCPEFCLGTKNLNVGANAVSNVSNVDVSVDCDTKSTSTIENFTVEGYLGPTSSKSLDFLTWLIPVVVFVIFIIIMIPLMIKKVKMRKKHR